MRVAIWHNLPNGGGKRALFDQIRGLLARGHEVEVWCPPTADSKYLPLRDLVREHIVPLRAFSDNAYGIFGRLLHVTQDTEFDVRCMEEHCRECVEEMMAGKFDVILAHPCRFFGTSAIGKFSQVPTVLYLQEPYRLFYEALPRLPWEASKSERLGFSRARWRHAIRSQIMLRQRSIQVREERAWAEAFTRILVNSRFSRESVLRAYNRDSRVCYLGVDMEKFVPTGERKEPMVIGLGAIGVHKRVNLAIEAVGAIPEEKRPPLVWVGNGANESYVRELEMLAAARKVSFTAKVMVTDAELCSLLSRASAMIYAPHLEPFGYAPLEANACGTAVVGVAEGGVRETIEHGTNGMLVESADPEALGRALLRFVSDLEFASRFGAQAREHVLKRWSNEDAVVRLEHELVSCAQGTRRLETASVT